jgi:MFS family permease
MFWLFALLRSLVGVGEASYSCVAPTIIGDLYKNNMRTRMLAVFIFAIPIGCGLGFILGSTISAAFSNWRWALRITPAVGLVCVFLVAFIDEPKRGKSEGLEVTLSNTRFTSDMVYLIKKFVFFNFVFIFNVVIPLYPSH